MVLSLKITSRKNIINYRIDCYAKYSRMVTNKPRNKSFQRFWAGSGLYKWKNSRKTNVGLHFSGEKIRVTVVMTYRFTDCITSVSHSTLREAFGFGDVGTIQREEAGLFFFSLVQSFKNGITYPFRSECADMESEGQLSFQDCKLPYCNYQICVWCALSQTPLEPCHCKEPLSLSEWLRQLHRTNPTTWLRSSILRLYLSASLHCRICLF